MEKLIVSRAFPPSLPAGATFEIVETTRGRLGLRHTIRRISDGKLVSVTPHVIATAFSRA